MADSRASSSTLPRDNRSYIWLAVGCGLLLFCAGRWVVPAAAWLWPVFLVRFMRTQPLFRGYFVTVAGVCVASAFAAYGMVPQPLPVFLATLVIGGAMIFLPFLFDRWQRGYSDSFLSTLALPAALVVLEYVSAQGNPFGTWGSFSYTQFNQLPLLQLTSVTGLWGITFLLFWSASVVNWAWEREFSWPSIRRNACIFFTVIAAILVLGGRPPSCPRRARSPGPLSGPC